ncbi:MAG: hypothetical protein IJY70_03605 [Clostridia bacterium]|nr:hypothetical protein [Clostridia bacterium]
MEENKTCSGACGSCSADSCADRKNENKTEEVNTELLGLDYLTKLSYAVIDRDEDTDFEVKRNLLFSVYSFRCLFDNTPLYSLSKTLVKYGCSFYTQTDLTGKENTYKVTDSKGQVAYKFDAGSPVWRENVKSGKITGVNATIPEKFTLYETVYKIVSLKSATAEVKGLWLVYFPYVFMIGAPVEYDIYDELKKVIHTPEVFSAVLAGRYGDNICCTTEELNCEHPFIVDWYAPFVEWKSEKNEKGVSRETAKYQRALTLGDYAYAIDGTEKLLNSFPDDEEILLLNISARTSLSPSLDFEKRVKMLSETFNIIGDAFKTPLKKYHYFLYYRGLTRLGMNMPDHAECDFKACLEIEPNFEPALLMLKGIENAKNKPEEN